MAGSAFQNFEYVYPKVSVRMSASLSTLFTSPARFFDSRSEDPGRLGPVLVVALTGTITLSAQLLLTSMSIVGEGPSIAYVTNAVRVQLPAMAVGGAAISFGHVFGYWIIYSLIFYLVTVPFSEEKDFRTLFWLSGWGFLPWFLSGVFWLIAMIWSAFSVQAPTMAAGNAVFVERVQETLFVQASRPVEILGVVWSLGLWTILVKKLRSVETWQALVAILPVALFELAKTLVLV